MEVQWRPGGGVNECDLGTAQEEGGFGDSTGENLKIGEDYWFECKGR